MAYPNSLIATDSSLESLHVALSKITFSSPENGYFVGQAKAKGHARPVTIVGTLFNPAIGENFDLMGRWVQHEKYGQQFLFESYTQVMPTTTSGILAYLESGMVKGIGSGLAARIVKHFGDDTLTVIDTSPARLGEVSGIGPQKIAGIITAWEEQKEVRIVMMQLQSFGISPAYAIRIYKKYKSNAVRAVQNNPYILTEIDGIGFVIADSIAQKMGFAPDSPLRAEAGLVFALQKMRGEGHVFAYQKDLIEYAKELLKIHEVLVEDALENLLLAGEAVKDTQFASKDNPAIYLPALHEAEKITTQHIYNILQNKNKLRVAAKPEAAIEWVAKELNIQLAPRQQDAIRAALTEKMLIITGGAGTGKTTILKAILKIFAKKTHKILLTAPTGRAAKRMTEACELEAKTIHRLLEFSPTEGFCRKDDTPLDCDLLVVDEASMVDMSLMHCLIRAVPHAATVILLGDINQLPSVGAGCVLKDLIQSQKICVVKLDQIFRQAQQSKIITNAHHIISGKMPDLNPASSNADFYFQPVSAAEQALQSILRIVKERIPSVFGYDPVNDVQVLAPMNRGPIGTERLNECLQEALNPNGFQLVRGRKTFRVGDKVMQLRNNYEKNVFNGDMGRITQIDAEEKQITVQYDTSVVYEYAELDELSLAYAISIHKSQGSEYPAVVMPLLTSHYIMLQRNLLYTGVTRGRNLVVVVGSGKAVGMAVKNNQQTLRNSLLHKRISSMVITTLQHHAA